MYTVVHARTRNEHWKSILPYVTNSLIRTLLRHFSNPFPLHVYLTDRRHTEEKIMSCTHTHSVLFTLHLVIIIGAEGRKNVNFKLQVDMKRRIVLVLITIWLNWFIHSEERRSRIIIPDVQFFYSLQNHPFCPTLWVDLSFSLAGRNRYEIIGETISFPSSPAAYI